MPRDNNEGRIVQSDNRQGNMDKNRSNVSKPDLDQLGKESEKLRTKKPGSQSNSSKRHNNGRGGGK